MINLKLSGLLVLVLLISSCVSMASAEKAALTPLANDFNPFATPTPTPTATPLPTPTPTPKPEPTVWPTLDLRCTTGGASSNPKIQFSGTLTYNKTGIPNAAVYIGFSADGGSSWENITLVQTRSDGTFAAVWVPNATGNYVLDAHWSGNDTLHWLDAKVNLALTADSAGNEFSVASNSTITDFAYNPTTQVLSFTTNGTDKTTGNMYANIPKALISDVQSLQVTKDGQSIAFGSESQEDVWVISCMYSQSMHAFVLQIPFGQALTSDSTPWTAIIVAAVVVALIAVVAVLVVVRRRRRTAATVAAILKQDRPTF